MNFECSWADVASTTRVLEQPINYLFYNVDGEDVLDVQLVSW